METNDLIQHLLDFLHKDRMVDATRISNLSAEGWQSLLALAATQRVRPLLWHRLRQKGLDETVPHNVAVELRKVFLRNTMCNLRRYGELRCLLSALKAEGITLILLKGMVLADAVYDNMGLREMTDIDVLAHPSDISRISEILEGLGYTSPQVSYSDNHLPPMIKSGCSPIEIHWNLIKPSESYSIDPECLWGHAVTSQIASCTVLTLSHEELLLHLCLHTSYQHQFAFGLRPSCDIAETIARFGSSLDWQAITERAVSRGWQRGVYLALRLARDLAGADVPVDVLQRLRPTDMTEAVLGIAHAQIFNNNGNAIAMPVSLAALLDSSRLRDKIRILWQRVFLSRDKIAEQYSVAPDSIRIYGYYLCRLGGLLRRHGRTLEKYQQNDAPLRARVERTNRISNWLAGPVVLRK